VRVACVRELTADTQRSSACKRSASLTCRFPKSDPQFTSHPFQAEYGAFLTFKPPSPRLDIHAITEPAKEGTKGNMQRAPKQLQIRENSCHSRKNSPQTAEPASCWSRRLVAPKSYEGGSPPSSVPCPFSNLIKVFKGQHHSIHPKKPKFIQPNQSISNLIKVNQTHPPQLSTFNPQPPATALAPRPSTPRLLKWPHRHGKKDFQIPALQTGSAGFVG